MNLTSSSALIDPVKPVAASTSLASPSQTTESSTTVPTGWSLLKIDKYKFEISYPPNWISAQNISDPSNPSPPLIVFNLASPRITAGDMQTNVIVIAVYNPPTHSLPDWLAATYNTDFTKISSGGPEEALVRARSAREGGFVSKRSSQVDETASYELGEVARGGGTLIYTTYIIGNEPYVYGIEMHLSLASDTATQPSDSNIVKQYEQIVSTFSILH